MTFEIIAANLVIFIAAVVQAATGVGFAMVAVPLLALINLAWVPAPMLICNIGLSLVIMMRSLCIRSTGGSSPSGSFVTKRPHQYGR